MKLISIGSFSEATRQPCTWHFAINNVLYPGIDYRPPPLVAAQTGVEPIYLIVGKCDLCNKDEHKVMEQEMRKIGGF